jgi:hypothetical protein
MKLGASFLRLSLVWFKVARYRLDQREGRNALAGDVYVPCEVCTKKGQHAQTFEDLTKNGRVAVEA